MGYYERGFEPHPLDELGDDDIQELGVTGLREMGVSWEDIEALGLDTAQARSGECYYHRLSPDENQNLAESVRFRHTIETAKRPAYDEGKIALELSYDDWIEVFDAIKNEQRLKLLDALERQRDGRGVVVVREAIFFSDEEEEEFKQAMIKEHGKYGVRFTF
jgi:hypothetical protein